MTAPDYLVTPTFLGRATGKGVNPQMAERLAAVEADLQAQYDALTPDEQGDSFITWCGLHEATGGWRHDAGYHASGSAVDLNVTTCPYIPTRTNGVPGGEAGAAPDVLAAAVSVYDRAVRCFEGSLDAAPADVGDRRDGEDTGSVWDRFSDTSGALVYYLAFAVKSDLIRIDRTPVKDPENASTDALDRIPVAERWDKETGLGMVQEFLGGHEDWDQDAETLYYRILRDYELVRIPMEYGTPSRSPGHTRNPARGFLDLPRWLVVSMHDSGGLRWGAADFHGGRSGDVQHFDLNGHAGYPPA